MFLLRLLRAFAIKVTPDLRETIRLRAILKENMANYISVDKLINVDLGKKFRKRKSQATAKTTMCHFIELLGYQNQAHWQNNCTTLIAKDQSPKVCEHFSIF